MATIDEANENGHSRQGSNVQAIVNGEIVDKRSNAAAIRRSESPSNLQRV